MLQAPGSQPSETILTPALSRRRYVKVDEVAEDEMCYLLMEHTRLRDDQQARHRFQVIQVIRETKEGQQYFAECSYDLGPSSLYTDEGFSIPGGVTQDNGRIVIEHTVGESIEMAFLHRGYAIDPDRLIIDGPTLLEQFADLHSRKAA